MEFFSMLERIIEITDPKEKIEHFNHFYENFQNLPFDHTASSKVFEQPSYASFCKVVDPKKVPRRKLGTKEGRAVLLHAVAHIEYSAIDLALDAAYRFKSMPKEFYEDWLEVAQDECRHFLMIEALLQELGYRYGDFEVHRGLFDAAKATPHLLERMAVVPRYLEANGLDANPKIIAKLERIGDRFSLEIAKALRVILEEEVGHVRKGDRWFRWACEKEGIEDVVECYFKIVERIYPGTRHSKQMLNIPMRQAAGFSCDEIKILAKEKIRC